MTWRALLREPLVQFLLVGLALFALHARVRPDPDRAMRVDPDRVASTRAGLAERLGRAPDDRELAAALRDALDDERMVREAVRLGLDRDDPIVRRRLIQKLRLAYESTADVEAPDDAALLALRDAEPARYSAPARLALTQVLAARGRHPDPEAAARELVRRLEGGADPAELGDPGPHARRFGLRPASDYAGMFGPDFAAALSDMPEGTWSIVQSQLGAHAVRIDARAPAELLPLAAARPRLMADLAERRRAEAVQAALDDLRRSDPADLDALPADLAAALAEQGL
ncbi:peptidylprolyl isomerase [Nannocystis sp. ILAH1]|uniref:peptidylprolyl isomerase n=1 Tax=unclassified Nannocystis TaxID=2627009 RepID=UPI0022710DFF|nr:MULTISPECIES: peptidylprolyl isomerase [unclassified Nannocystis]MCY0993309.1 peptidylprolyl isomerase [Nannocystis sp. ILAH1]MCY1063258.1 peptidylprolyl isomerase [Nannocystis sp. RBIL2]